MSNKLYQFHNFTLDKNSRQLLVNSKTVQISSRAFDLLSYLIENKGTVLSKNDLLDNIWKDSFVEEANLPVHISALRKALNETKNEHKFIKTVSGKGYVFVGKIREIESRSIDNSKIINISSEAKILYHRGKTILESRLISKNLKEVHFQALDFFRQAIMSEPNYALAYVGLGTTYMSLRNHSLIEKDVATSEANKAVQTAIDIDNSLSEVHILKGMIKYMIEKDFDSALDSYDKAIELNPENPDGYHWKGIVFNTLGMSEIAIALANKAIELDPSNIRRSSQLVRYYFFAKDFNKSIAYAEELLEFNNREAAMYFFLTANYIELRLFDLALENSDTCLKYKNISEHHINRAFLYSEFGHMDKALELKEKIIETFPENEISNTSLAMLCSSLGQINKAFELLFKDLTVSSSDLNLLKIDHRYKNLHQDKRFDEILKKLNLL